MRAGEYRLGRLAVVLLAVIAVILVVAALHSTAPVSSTVALAFFVALATWPVDQAIRERAPASAKWLGHLAALGLMLVIFGLFLGGLVLSARQVIGTLPRYENLAENWIDRLGRLSDMPGVAASRSALTDQLINPVVGFAATVVQSTSSLAAILSLIFFMVLLMLVEAPRFAEKLDTISGNDGGNNGYDRILLAIAERVRWYLAIRTLVGLMTAAFYFGWSWAWGLDFVVVWALLAFLFNYVPTIGSLMAGLLPTALAFLQLDAWSAVLFGAGVIAFEQVMGNYIDPKLQGRQLALSPLTILIALLFWSWVWGVAGALVAVPMTLVVLIVCEHVAPLRPFALFLSNCRTMDGLRAAIEET